MANYLKVIYSRERTPITDYPKKLCTYLFQTYAMKKGMKFIEVGCGRGEFLQNFKNLGLECYGVDYSSEAGSETKNINIKVCDLEKGKLPFKKNFADVIYSKSFLEHINNPKNFLREALRVLKPGGLLLTLVPDWETNYKIYFDDYTHRTPYTSVSLEDVYNIFGFKRVQVIKFRQLPIVWKYPILNYFCALIAPFIPVRTKNKFLRWSREIMLIGVGYRSSKNAV